MIDEPLTLAYTRGATILGFVHFFTMLLTLTIYANLIQIPRSYRHAAADLGASSLQVFLRVTLPLSIPGVAVGAFLTFVITIGDYITPQILGGNTEVLVPSGNHSADLTCRRLPHGIGDERDVDGRRHRHLSGLRALPENGSAMIRTWIGQTAAGAYLLLGTGSSSTCRLSSWCSFRSRTAICRCRPSRVRAFNGTMKLFANERLMDALFNSVVVAVLSGAVTTLLGFLAAYGLSRSTVRFEGFARFLLIAPITVSYLIIGMGLLTTFSVVGFSKSLLAVGIGHVVINLPLALCDHLLADERAAQKHRCGGP